MTSCHASIAFSKTSQGVLTGLSLLLVICISCGCAPEDSAPAPTASSETYFPITIGDVPLNVQLALTPAEQQRGLMFRKSMNENDGMLFLFPRSEPRGFWMRNTSLPLDIGYFDADGKLIEVYPLFPFDENPVNSRSTQIMIAVETNRGWYESNGVKPGAQIDMQALQEAVAQRGHAHPRLQE